MIEEFLSKEGRENTPVLSEKDEMLEMAEEFSFDDFQVVRREFFAHMREPSITFNDCKFSVNSACLSKFPYSDFAQVLVNREKKILALRPCHEEARDCYMWCKEKNGKRQPRPITCKMFFAKIVSLMGWNPHYRYKLLGKIIHSKDEYMIAFDLTSTEVYKKEIRPDGLPKSSRVPVYPSEWQNQFGLSYSEHKQSLQINIFDDYAIYAIKDTDGQTETNSTQISRLSYGTQEG